MRSIELIPKEHWDVPEWINQSRMEEAFNQMQATKVQHATQLSYHKMCRWFSGFFFRHPALDKYKYYWRVEPDVKYGDSPISFCLAPCLNKYISTSVHNLILTDFSAISSTTYFSSWPKITKPMASTSIFTTTQKPFPLFGQQLPPSFNRTQNIFSAAERIPTTG